MKDRIQSAFAEIHADGALIDSTAAYLRRELKKRGHKNKRFVIPKLAGAFAAVAGLVIGIFAYTLYFTADAYVSIDVNPSIELTLNRFDKVIAAHAFNGDGERILNASSLRWKSYDEAAGLLMSAFEDDGYLVKDALVSVTIQAENSDRERLLCSALRRLINDRILSMQATAEVEVFPVTAEVWQDARGCHMSPAKYLAIQELMEVDEEATIEAYSGSTIRQIRRRAQECRGAHNSESNGGNSEASPPSEHGQGHGNGNGHGHGYRGGR